MTDESLTDAPLKIMTEMPTGTEPLIAETLAETVLKRLKEYSTLMNFYLKSTLKWKEALIVPLTTIPQFLKSAQSALTILNTTNSAVSCTIATVPYAVPPVICTITILQNVKKYPSTQIKQVLRI